MGLIFLLILKASAESAFAVPEIRGSVALVDDRALITLEACVVEQITGTMAVNQTITLSDERELRPFQTDPRGCVRWVEAHALDKIREFFFRRELTVQERPGLWRTLTGGAPPEQRFGLVIAVDPKMGRVFDVRFRADAISGMEEINPLYFEQKI